MATDYKKVISILGIVVSISLAVYLNRKRFKALFGNKHMSKIKGQKEKEFIRDIGKYVKVAK